MLSFADEKAMVQASVWDRLQLSMFGLSILPALIEQWAVVGIVCLRYRHTSNDAESACV